MPAMFMIAIYVLMLTSLHLFPFQSTNLLKTIFFFTVLTNIFISINNSQL
ncbi:hypothetical protein KSF78_0001774 [Schistosoma japonicum]|nr:hypothetical protein KSF78_0001774 [Schistosoma japonicum]